MASRSRAVLLLVLAAGCAGEQKFDTRTPHVEEFVVPPDEARFNQPPEAGYRKPPAKKDFRPGMGGGGGMPSGGGMMPGQ